MGRSRVQIQRRALGAVKAGAYRTGLHRLVLPRYEYMFRPQQLCLLCQFLTETNHLSGPILEIGVAGGATTVFLNKHLEDLGSDRTYHCIDTFEGFTPADIDVERRRGKQVQPYEEVFRNYSEQYLRRTLTNNRIEGTKIHKADIADFDFAGISDISFCLIDVDLFAPVAAALRDVVPLMASNGVILVDDCEPDNDYDGAYEAYVDAVRSLGEPVDIRHGKLGVIRIG